MNVQYISDSSGITSGVFIPINEWNELKSKYKGIEQTEMEIPDWLKTEVRERLAAYKTNPQQAQDFDSAMDDLEKEI